jgi:hypothetical protein
MIRTLAILAMVLLPLMACNERVEESHYYGFAEKPEAPTYDYEYDIAPKENRHIAVNHYLVIETSEKELPKVWESTIEFCRQLNCEILSTNILKESNYPPSASLSLRIAPDGVDKLMEHLRKEGDIIQHQTESEDKTEIVIDTEAKIKNLTSLRNRLRKMLESRTGNLKDVLEIERELSKTQAELDSLEGTRKALAQQTENVSMTIDFRARQSIARRGVFSPVGSALRDAVGVCAESLAALITFIAAIVPWLVIIVPGVWFTVKLFKKFYKRKPKEA